MSSAGLFFCGISASIESQPPEYTRNPQPNPEFLALKKFGRIELFDLYLHQIN